jgi:aldehyde dehydrogenase (NAD+)
MAPPLVDTPLGTLISTNPAAPGQTVATVRLATPEDLASAVERASAAQAGWGRSGSARSAALTAFADALAARTEELVELIVAEVGKPVAEARGEVARALAIIRYYAQQALAPEGLVFPSPDGVSALSARREPLGTVLVVAPWNFPLAIPIWKAAPALAYGNVVLLKPAAAAVGVAAAIADCAAAALPDDVLAVTLVRGADLGDLLDDPQIAAVTFTGSTQVGSALIERLARRGAPIQAEMGGQNPAIVLSDADLDRAAEAIVSGAAAFAGQKCTATRRVIAVADIRDALVERLRERWSALRVGDPRDPEVTVGPVIDAAARDEVRQASTAALAEGGELLATAPVPESDGHYVAPALVALDDPRAPANQEETFGPLLTVLRARDTERALELANATPFGLVGAVHGRDLGRATAVATNLRCGMQRVNAPTSGVDFYAPFGGTGASSYGPREQGEAAREFFTSWRTLTVTPVP